MRSPLFSRKCNCTISFLLVVNKLLTGCSPSSTCLSSAGKTTRLHPRVWMRQQTHKGNDRIHMAFVLQPFLRSWPTNIENITTRVELLTTLCLYWKDDCPGNNIKFEIIKHNVRATCSSVLFLFLGAICLSFL